MKRKYKKARGKTKQGLYKIVKAIKWFFAFLIIAVSLIITTVLEPITGAFFAGAIVFFVGLILLNKGNKLFVNLRTDILPIAFAFVMIVAAAITFYATGNFVAIVVAIVLIVLIILLYAFI